MSVLNRKIGRIIQSETLMATAADARNDVITTATVLVASVLTWMTRFDRLDGIMGLGVAAFILYSGIQLVRDTIDPILAPHRTRNWWNISRKRRWATPACWASMT